MPKISRDTKIMLAVVAFGFAVGTNFMFVKLLVGEISPLQLVTGRLALAAAPLLALTMIYSRPRITVPFVTGAAVLGAIDTVAPYLLIAWGQQSVASSTAALLIATMPFFTTLLAARTSESASVTSTAVRGLLCGLAGIALLAGPSAFDPSSSGTWGMLAVLTAAFCYAAGAIYSRTLSHHADPVALSAVKLALATCFLVPATASIEGFSSFATLSSQGWLGLVLLGFVSTGIGRCIYQWVVVTAGSVRASQATNIGPVVAVFVGWAFLGEPMGISTLTAASLIAAGVITVMYGSSLRAWLKSIPAAVRLAGIRGQEPVSMPVTRGSP
jgi:drug/metabolite transporter (DMT)-like permease